MITVIMFCEFSRCHEYYERFMKMYFKRILDIRVVLYNGRFKEHNLREHFIRQESVSSCRCTTRAEKLDGGPSQFLRTIFFLFFRFYLNCFTDF